jgi:hypothetical protein
MIEIVCDTHEERILRLLQRIYPITDAYIKDELNLSDEKVTRVLKKFQVQGIVKLDPLPDKTFVSLLRHDIHFVGKKRQRKFIKHTKNKIKEKEEYSGIMYS